MAIFKNSNEALLTKTKFHLLSGDLLGNHNIAIGYEGGRGDTSRNDNIAIGRNTLSTVSGGVALGGDSVSRASAGVAGYVPTGATAAQQAAISATTSTQGAVSVGDVEGALAALNAARAAHADALPLVWDFEPLERVTLRLERGLKGRVEAALEALVG